MICLLLPSHLITDLTLVGGRDHRDQLRGRPDGPHPGPDRQVSLSVTGAWPCSPQSPPGSLKLLLSFLGSKSNEAFPALPGYWAEPAEHLNSIVMFVLTKLRYHIVKRPANDLF